MLAANRVERKTGVRTNHPSPLTGMIFDEAGERLVENANDRTAADPSLLRILARAHDVQARLIQNPALSCMT